VQVWTDLGEHDWSDQAWFETGLLEPGDWQAQWVEPDESERRAGGDRSAYVLRRTFTLEELAPGARLYATAHGIYETFLNGHRVGDLELTPGFTSYWANLHVQTYDVDDLVIVGENIWEVVLSDGWYRGRVGFTQEVDSYGDTVAFLGQLHVGDQIVVSDAQWTSAPGPIVVADLMAGQREDHRVEPGPWRPVVVVEHDLDRLAASPAPPTRRVQAIRPAGVTRLPGGAQVVDLGQNINGWVRLHDLGPEGTQLTLTHGEALDHDGDVTQDHLGAFDMLTREPLSVGQIDHVVSAGGRGRRSSPGTPPTASSTSASRATPSRSPPTTSMAWSCTPTCIAPAGSAAATPG
jgi:alpha-L-rhamnosidase